MRDHSGRARRALRDGWVAGHSAHPGRAGDITPSGVAVRARTFGQAIDALRALEVTWNDGTLPGKNSDDIMKVILEHPVFAQPSRPMFPAAPGDVIEDTIRAHYRNSSPLEPNCAVADVKGDTATVWSAAKVPLASQYFTAEALGIPQSNLTFNVVYGGGSFGRKLNTDFATEAARCSQMFGKPVKLMWADVDNQRHGRMHPGNASTVRFTVSGRSITSYTQRHVSGASDFSHGLGDVGTTNFARTAAPGRNSYGNEGVTRYFFQLVTAVPYNFGATDVGLDEVFGFETLPTSAVRQVYSPDVGAMRELMVDRVADHMGLDYYEFRRAFLKHDYMKATLDKAAEMGNWGKKMAPGTAQAIACHEEYKGFQAAVMEIDNRPAQLKQTVNGIPVGPRITACHAACDVGLPVNPDNVLAQFMGGIIDGISFAMTQAQHFEDGAPVEGSYDQNLYSRQWNTPPVFEVAVMPARRDYPGGAGEIGNAAGYGGAACAYQRVSGQKLLELPVNFRNKRHFFPYERGTIPASPDNLLP